MRPPARLIIFLVCFSWYVFLQSSSATVSDTRQQQGVWASAGISLYDGLNAGVEAKAPDSTAAVYSSDKGISLRKTYTDDLLPIVFTPGLAEATWSHDSRYVALNVSDGGLVGTWDVYLVDRVKPSKVIKLRDAIRLSTSVHLRCDGEELNIGAVGWEKSAANLDVIVEVPPHSSCMQMGHVEGLVLDVDRLSVVAHLKESDVRTLWQRLLGNRFSGR